MTKLEPKKSEPARPEPKLRITWIRHANDDSAKLKKAITRPITFAVVGGQGAGKSALVETIGHKYPRVIDLFGSRDNEGLGWLRSPRRDSCLLLKGNSVTLDTDWPNRNATDLTLKTLGEYKAIVSVSAFYSNLEEEWYALKRIMEKLWHRSHWREPCCLLIREASSFIYSRVGLGESQTQAKNQLIYTAKEMRHCGFAVALDTIRWMSLDVELRNIAEYTFIKAQGIEGLPKGLRFMYRFFKPSGMARCPKNAYAVVSRKAPLGFGTSDLPFWHKREEEDLLRKLGIFPKYGEIPFQPEGRMSNVGDYEHGRIIKLRVKKKGKRKGQPISMEDMAKSLGRTTSTIFRHLNYHNNMVHSVGECDRCLRIGSDCAKIPCD